jgi:hypothetical protein
MIVVFSQRQLQTVLFAALALFWQAALVQAQTAPIDLGKSSGAQPIQTFPEPGPQADEDAISRHKKVLRAEIAIDSTNTVRFYEEPTSERVYNSSISIERHGASIATYNVGKMIKHQPLRLVHAALIRSNDGGILVCEYEGGAVGAREGFAILHFSPIGFELHTLPLTDFGKIVVFRSKPEQAEIWSALADDAGSSAGPMAYATQSCHWQEKGYSCSAPKRKPGRFSPASINDPGIEIRP